MQKWGMILAALMVVPGAASSQQAPANQWGFFYMTGYELRDPTKSYASDCWRSPTTCNPQIGVYLAYSDVKAMGAADSSGNGATSKNACDALVKKHSEALLTRRNLGCWNGVYWQSYTSEQEAKDRLAMLVADFRKKKPSDQAADEYVVDTFEVVRSTRRVYRLK